MIEQKKKNKKSNNAVGSLTPQIHQPHTNLVINHSKIPNTDEEFDIYFPLIQIDLSVVRTGLRCAFYCRLRICGW